MDKSIRLQRTESVLKELLQEALSSLGDSTLNTLGVTDVVCSKGKYYAEVFIYPEAYTPKEQQAILHALKKAEGILREYVLSVSGWYKCPKFKFCFDESLERAKTLDALFAQIASNHTKNGENGGEK
ncbi:ribosome-binding factor A [Helicobacter sp. 12S02634-8]|uniref:30S ribosome-binding factor RbfA n=1 Tax=Helicobacter sp. 12S02634-8 TaxID=1476199 RepID=UPI000BA5B990|nr:30S ribosome-binding factor RbfA [Helicobacter sp. 12S02634-8]PAF47521.1 ribosome-binding factor A [Helicobacter sp. 12S02634-8]